MNTPLCKLSSVSAIIIFFWQSESIFYIYMFVWWLFRSFLTILPCHHTKHHSGVGSIGNVYIFKALSIIWFLAVTAVFLFMFSVCNYPSSQTNVSGRHLSYTKLHRLTNNPTRHPQGVPSLLLNFPTLQMTINTCSNTCCRTAVFTQMHNFSMCVYMCFQPQ